MNCLVYPYTSAAVSWVESSSLDNGGIELIYLTADMTFRGDLRYNREY